MRTGGRGFGADVKRRAAADGVRPYVDRHAERAFVVHAYAPVIPTSARLITRQVYVRVALLAKSGQTTWPLVAGR